MKKKQEYNNKHINCCSVVLNSPTLAYIEIHLQNQQLHNYIQYKCVEDIQYITTTTLCRRRVRRIQPCGKKKNTIINPLHTPPTLHHCVFLTLESLQLLRRDEAGLKTDNICLVLEEPDQKVKGELASLGLLVEASVPAFHVVIRPHWLHEGCPFPWAPDAAGHPRFPHVRRQVVQPRVGRLFAQRLEGLGHVFGGQER